MARISIHFFLVNNSFGHEDSISNIVGEIFRTKTLCEADVRTYFSLLDVFVKNRIILKMKPLLKGMSVISEKVINNKRLCVVFLEIISSKLNKEESK